MLKKNNEDIAFHAKQGFIQMVLWLLIPYILLIPLVGWVVGALLVVVNIALMLTGVFNAANNKNNYTPLIGKFVEKILT